MPTVPVPPSPRAHRRPPGRSPLAARAGADHRPGGCFPILGAVVSRFTGAPAVSRNRAVETNAGESSGYSSACRWAARVATAHQPPYEADGFPSRSKTALFGQTKLVVNRQDGHLSRPRI